jgi:hypothetical protein
LRGQCQLAAGDKIELSCLAPDLQYDGAYCIAGERIGGRPQRMIHVRGVDADEKAWIETQFDQAARRDGTRFDLGEILPDPNHRTPRGHAPCDPRDKSGRRGALPSGLRKHLVHGAQNEAALQARVRILMSERHLSQAIRRAMRLEAFDAAAQGRNRARGADLTFATLLIAIS